MTAQEAIKSIDCLEKQLKDNSTCFQYTGNEVESLQVAKEALENQEAMKQAIYKASGDIDKIIRYPNTVLGFNQFWGDLQRIQDDLVGVLED